MIGGMLLMQQVYIKEFNREAIGMGFNSQSGLAIGTALDVVGPILPDPSAPGQEVEAEITIINTHEELMEKLGMSFEAGGRYGFFSASAKAEFSESSGFNSTSTFLVARCIVKNPFLRGKGFHVKPEAQALLDSHQTDKFKTAYGDGFVRGLQTGGEYYAIIRITSVSVKKQEELSVMINAAFNGLAAAADFQAAYNKANESESTRSEYTAKMFQRAGSGPQISPVVEIEEALKRYKEFPEIAKTSAVAFQTEIADYNTLPLLLPTAEEQENFFIAMRDARDKKLYYIQKRNDLEFAVRNPMFFEGLPAPEVLSDAIRVYTQLINAVMDYANDLSVGVIKKPKLFTPPINEPAPIPLKRVKTQVGNAVVPNLVGMNLSDAEHLLKSMGLNPVKRYTGHFSVVSIGHELKVISQNPIPGTVVPNGADIVIYHNFPNYITPIHRPSRLQPTTPFNRRKSLSGNFNYQVNSDDYQNYLYQTFPYDYNLDYRQLACPSDGPCKMEIYKYGLDLIINWHDVEYRDCFNFRWSRPGRQESHNELSGGYGGQFVIRNFRFNTPYVFKVQGCNTHIFALSTCTNWTIVNYHS
ncbi:hypothetical protein COJ42_13735 [Bacillus cereus]|nr:hypothetical protein CN464_07320 [Bacillus cereus]PFM33859.1 hypothetical protein COJ42_13735 [Bacillus cereus]PFP92817.1 hypothetical protein COK02_12455 [Bacillus cereus]